MLKTETDKFESALQAADSGDFKGAAELLNDQEATELVGLRKLSRALKLLQTAWRDGGEDFRCYFDWLRLQTPNMITVYSVFNEGSNSIQPMLEQFECFGDGKFNVFGGLELVTIGEQRCSMSLHNSTLAGQTQLVHFIAAFPSNVGNDFFFSLDGKDRREVFRFNNGGVALVNDNTLVECDAHSLKLYTILLQPGELHFYINGVLQQIRKRSNDDASIETISIDLMGNGSADLSGIIYGLEVWKGNGVVENLFGNNQKLFLNRLKNMIAHGKTGEIYGLLSGVENNWAHPLTSELLAYLDVCLSTEKGFQEWVFQTILEKVEQEEAEKWKQAHLGELPSPILTVRDVTAEFMISPNNTFSIMSILRKKGRKRFLALDEINFDIYPGDIVGIIGENGAGKSTLLKTVAGLVPINKGEILLKAKHMLLSPGLGVRNELTGRENAYLAGVFMGLTKEQMDGMINEIINFSELGDAIDKPFKYYSDGMKGRLVFSLATCVSPDLLMLDELLSAGDIKFQQKAAERMDQIIDGAKSVVIVTHSMPFVTERCNKAILISKGRVAYYGDPKQTVSVYLNQLHMGSVDSSSDFCPLNVTMHQHLQQTHGFDSSVG